MWVFDGEQWIEEGASPEAKTPREMPMWDESMPELQVIEILPTRPARPNYLPPLP